MPCAPQAPPIFPAHGSHLHVLRTAPAFASRRLCREGAQRGSSSVWNSWLNLSTKHCYKTYTYVRTYTYVYTVGPDTFKTCSRSCSYTIGCSCYCSCSPRRGGSMLGARRFWVWGLGSGGRRRRRRFWVWGLEDGGGRRRTEEDGGGGERKLYVRTYVRTSSNLCTYVRTYGVGTYVRR